MLHTLKAYRRLLRVFYKEDTIAAVNILYSLSVFFGILVCWEGCNKFNTQIALAIRSSWIATLCMLLVSNWSIWLFTHSYKEYFSIIKLVYSTALELLCIYLIALLFHWVYILSNATIVKCIDIFVAS